MKQHLGSFVCDDELGRKHFHFANNLFRLLDIQSFHMFNVFMFANLMFAMFEHSKIHIKCQWYVCKIYFERGKYKF